PEVAELFARVRREQGHLDVLANAVWGGNEHVDLAGYGRPFWEEPEPTAAQWRRAMVAGPYAYLLASRDAARVMVEPGAGVSGHVTDGVMADGSQPYAGQVYADLAHAAVNRLTMAMSHDLKPRGVAVVAVMPGYMRTERVMMYMTTEEIRRATRFDLAE